MSTDLILFYACEGPMGICERDEYARGTTAVMRYLSDLTACGATTIVCGGETVAAVEREQHDIQLVQNDLRARLGGQAAELQGIRKLVYSHISTGGGAALEFLEGKELPGVAVLDDSATNIMRK
jgi:phosphoglycerate kinase